jgi:tetratricopeptide (TPR) repeat protein
MYRFWILLTVTVLLPGCGTAVPSPSEAQVCFANGERALGLGSYEVAIGWLSSAIAADPKNAAAHRLRAKAYVLKAEGMKPLTGMAAQKTAETPEKVVDNAIADATTALELDPRDAEAYLLRARAQRRKGGDKAKEQALADCDKALELATSGPLADEAKKVRDEIRGH